MRLKDVRDLFAYLKTLPPSDRASAPHRLRFPYSVRRSVGAWKLLYFRPKTFVADPARSAAWNRGAYLAQAVAHCAECHTPHDRLGGLEKTSLYAGAPNLEPGGRFAVNITPHKDGIGDWSEQDIADFLKSGTDRCFNEPVGMAPVLAGTRQLADADLAAIATYIHALPPKAGNGARKVC
jgi:mono/diheme cytochrome c family protein